MRRKHLQTLQAFPFIRPPRVALGEPPRTRTPVHARAFSFPFNDVRPVVSLGLRHACLFAEKK